MEALPAVSPPVFAPRYAETDFEKRRGISRVEIREGFAQVHIGGLSGDVMASRLRLLRAVAGAGVSIDFLKLTPSGMSFVVGEDRGEAIARALDAAGTTYSLARDRAILLVHAVNMRDEEGMVAGILREAIASEIQVDHASDMHDRVLLVLERGQAGVLKACLERNIPQQEPKEEGARGA